MSSAVVKIGNSLGVVIPKEFRESGFRQGARVEFEQKENGLLLKPIDELPTLQSLMQGYEGPKPEVIDTGAAVGREMW